MLPTRFFKSSGPRMRKAAWDREEPVELFNLPSCPVASPSFPVAVSDMTRLSRSNPPLGDASRRRGGSGPDLDEGQGGCELDGGDRGEGLEGRAIPHKRRLQRPPER